jgi:hypothetical protein
MTFNVKTEVQEVFDWFKLTDEKVGIWIVMSKGMSPKVLLVKHERVNIV